MKLHNLFFTLLCFPALNMSAWANTSVQGHANSNQNSREVSSATSGFSNKSFALDTAPVIKVATFNMAAGKVSNVETLAKAITAMDADIIALQEVDKLTARSGHINQPEKLAQLTNMHVAFGRAIDHDGGEYGLAFLSKYPIHDSEIVLLPSGQREQRIAFIAQVDVPNFSVPVTVVNTHLDTKEDPEIRLGQVRELNDRTMEKRGIKILFGDMNDVPDTVTYRELTRYWNDLTESAKDRRSWPAENPEIQVDYIFTGKAQKWHIDTITLPNIYNHQWKSVDWPAVSDHLPIFVEMRLIEQ